MYVHYIETGIDGCGMDATSTPKTLCTTRLASLDPDAEGRLQHYKTYYGNQMDGAVLAPHILTNWGAAIERNVITHLKTLDMMYKNHTLVWDDEPQKNADHYTEHRKSTLKAFMNANNFGGIHF
jgi:hypothetical protein